MNVPRRAPPTPSSNLPSFSPSRPSLAACLTTPSGGCPQFERHPPYSGTFFRVVEAELKTGCEAGPYRLKVFERVWSDADGRE